VVVRLALEVVRKPSQIHAERGEPTTRSFC